MACRIRVYYNKIMEIVRHGLVLLISESGVGGEDTESDVHIMTTIKYNMTTM